MKEILIIGTEPQCPRCRILTRIMREKAKEKDGSVVVRHIGYDSHEAGEIARKYSLVPGTAKDVARKTGKKINIKRLTALCEQENLQGNHPYQRYNDCNWSPELDEELRFYEKEARQVGIMMTPVLVIDGQIVHQGSVPPPEKVEEILRSL